MTSALVEGVRMQLKPAGMMDSKVSQKEFLKWREKLGDELHLIGIVGVVTVELTDGEIRRDRDPGGESRERDLRLAAQAPLGR